LLETGLFQSNPVLNRRAVVLPLEDDFWLEADKSP